MKKRIVTLVVFLLIACLTLTGCSSGDGAKDNTTDVSATEPAEQTETVEEAPQAENQNADGMYEWTVRGVTVRTRTNIMDYIHGNVWDERRMSADLGWTYPWDVSDSPNWYALPVTYDYENAHVNILRGDIEGTTTGEKYCYGVSYRFGDKKNQYMVWLGDLYVSRKPCDYFINHVDYRTTISFDNIVYYTCILEHLKEDTNSNPLEDDLGPLPYKRYVYEV